MKFTTISKIPNTIEMLMIPFLSMHYTIKSKADLGICEMAVTL